MNDLIEIFRMKEITVEARCKIIIELGKAINNRYGMNLTEPLVYELVKELDPNNEILKNEDFIYCATR